MAAIQTTELPVFRQAKSQTRSLITVDSRMVAEEDQIFQSCDFEYDLDIRAFGIPTNALPHLTPKFSLTSATATESTRSPTLAFSSVSQVRGLAP